MEYVQRLFINDIIVRDAHGHELCKFIQDLCTP